MYEVITIHEKDKWESCLGKMKTKDAHASYGYCSLYYHQGDGIPHLFHFWKSSGQRIAYPFLVREIQLPSFVQEDELYDIITPYGFGGPLVDFPDEDLLREFRQAFEDYCQEHKLISEFIRFNPMLTNHRFLEAFMDVVCHRESVYMDLTRDGEEMNKFIHHNHLRNIAKGKRNGLDFAVFEGEEALSYVRDFYRLYKETMDKVHAAPYYYFSEEFVKLLLTGMKGNSLLAAVFHQGEMIAACLSIYDGGIIHYHMGASRKDKLQLGSNPYLFYHLALWGRDRGFTRLHLGAGHEGRDSLFQFKHRFNLGGTVGFYIGKKIHNRKLYDQLCNHWKKLNGIDLGDFFPGYRSKPTKTFTKLVTT